MHVHQLHEINWTALSATFWVEVFRLNMWTVSAVLMLVESLFKHCGSRTANSWDFINISLATLSWGRNELMCSKKAKWTAGLILSWMEDEPDENLCGLELNLPQISACFTVYCCFSHIRVLLICCWCKLNISCCCFTQNVEKQQQAFIVKQLQEVQCICLRDLQVFVSSAMKWKQDMSTFCVTGSVDQFSIFQGGRNSHSELFRWRAADVDSAVNQTWQHMLLCWRETKKTWWSSDHVLVISHTGVKWAMLQVVSVCVCVRVLG